MDIRETAVFLWSLLDDIDTVSDAVKSDDKHYRLLVERIQRRRFEVGSTDGYTITFYAEVQAEQQISTSRLALSQDPKVQS